MTNNKFTLIADGGSTKADWRFLQNGKVTHELQTVGFNPNYHRKSEIIELLSGNFKRDFPVEEVVDIHFYGSGCSDEKRCDLVRDALFAVFPIDHISVNSDLLGAARATCLNEAGITVILGTGSNTILYSGKKTLDSISSLGFILGDEGGGNHLGKALLQAYFYREMPLDLMEKMRVLIPGGRSELLDNLYTPNAKPIQYLASFAPFYSDNLDHPFIEDLAARCFTELIERHVLKYENCKKLPIHFVGSIGYYLQSILRKLLVEKGLIFGNLIRSPIEGLVKFHLK